MNRNRIENVMKRTDCDALLISDPIAICYLTGARLYPGERFLALLLKKNETPKLFLNTLFPLKPIEGLETVSYSDGDDITKLVSEHVSRDDVLGVDKDLRARFLLPMIKARIAKEFTDGSLPVDKTRAVKDEKELELMRTSSRINDAAMERFKGLVYEGVEEQEIAAQMLDIYKELGAQAYSFPPIVAFGKNAADPHHMPDDTKLKAGDAVLFDVGCVYEGYCSDMTRTFFFKKGPNEIQRKVYELVRKANEDAAATVKEGVRLCDIDKTARDVIEQGGYGKYFTHRLGHFIGIEDHEYGDVSASFKDLTEENNIFSIEPGIYDPETLGCRIEDLVVVTKDGCEILNRYPHDIEIIG